MYLRTLLSAQLNYHLI